jgi:hypothetical protein
MCSSFLVLAEPPPPQTDSEHDPNRETTPNAIGNGKPLCYKRPADDKDERERATPDPGLCSEADAHGGRVGTRPFSPASRPHSAQVARSGEHRQGSKAPLDKRGSAAMRLSHVGTDTSSGVTGGTPRCGQRDDGNRGARKNARRQPHRKVRRAKGENDGNHRDETDDCERASEPSALMDEHRRNRERNREQCVQKHVARGPGSWQEQPKLCSLRRDHDRRVLRAQGFGRGRASLTPVTSDLRGQGLEATTNTPRVSDNCL